MKVILILAALTLPTFGHASFGDKIGNGGGLWACIGPSSQIEKAQLVDLFEAEREFQLTIPRTQSRDPMQFFNERKDWVAKNLSSLYEQLDPHFQYVERNMKVVNANLEPIDDTGLFRSKPPAAECATGFWRYTQFANSNDRGEVLIQSDLWNSAIVPTESKSALLFHEAIYRWLRLTKGDSDSQHTRKITGVLFSTLPASQIEERINNILGKDEKSASPVNEDSFFIRIANQSLGTSLHQADAAYGSDVGTTNFSSACRIPKGATGDLFCVGEVEELDLFFNTLPIEVNVPPLACSYVRYKPYSFYTHEAGVGPTVVKHEVTHEGLIIDGPHTKNGVATCAYDHVEKGGSNCCEGLYTHTTVQYASEGSITSSTSTTADWGGRASSCIAGPATKGPKNPRGFPKPTVIKVSGTGLNSIFEIPGAGQEGNAVEFNSNLFAANFYQPSEYRRYKPVALLPDSSGLYRPQDTYQWECLDGSGTVKSRIRLMIREWNTGPVQEGGEPDENGVNPEFPDVPLNDKWDWADFGDEFPGANLYRIMRQLITSVSPTQGAK